jgi:hypothetical protein
MSGMIEWRAALAAAALLLASAAAAAERPMTVAEFLVDVDAVKKAGRQAPKSPELAVMREVVEDAARAYRKRIESDRRAGLPPRSCPPPRGDAKIDAEALLKSFRALPRRKRSMSVHDAVFAAMDQQFACAKPKPKPKPKAQAQAKATRSGRAASAARHRRARR